jgi:hypothetical protein
MLTLILTTILPALYSFARGLVAPLFSYLTNKTNVQGQVDQATLAAQTATNQAKAQWLTSLGPMIVSCTLGELSALYYGSIILDSVFKFGWGIAKLPPPFDGYLWVIMSSFIITAPFVVRSK